jgi:lipopolysaccharide export system protein LptC
MTDFAQVGTPEPIRTAGPRHDAFRAAGRHSTRVRVLRRVILAGAVLGIAGIVVFAFFNPFRLVIPNLSINSVGLNGSQITMDQPKLNGFRSDGRPYSLLAKSAVQDAKTPNVLELHDIDAHVTMGDKSVIHVVSSIGFYDSSKETMELKSEVHLSSDNGLDVRMQSAHVEFKSGSVDTDAPLTVVMSTGTVSADSMHMTDNGKQISFEGNVHTVISPAATAAATAGTLKGSAQ